MRCNRDRSAFIDSFSLVVTSRFQLMRSSLGKIRRNTRLKVVLLLSPIFIFLMAFFVFPFVITVAYSFGQVDNFNRLIAVTFNLNYYAKALSVTPLTIVAKSLSGIGASGVQMQMWTMHKSFLQLHLQLPLVRPILQL